MYTLAEMRAFRLRDAAELLAQRGFDNVRAAELARATRLSVGSLYRHYGSKQGIARAIRTLTERELSYTGFVAYQMADGDPLRQGFRDVFIAFWREFATWALLQPHLVGFTFLHNHPDTDTPGEHDGRTRAQVLEVLEHGEREKVFPTGRTWLHECMVWGVLSELVRRAGRGEVVREEDVEAAAEVLWKALSVEESSKPRSGGNPPPEGEHPRPVLTADTSAQPGVEMTSAAPAEPSPGMMSPHEQMVPEVMPGPGFVVESPPATTRPSEKSWVPELVPGTALIAARRCVDSIHGKSRHRGRRCPASINDDEAIAAALVLGPRPHEQRCLNGLLAGDSQHAFAGRIDACNLRVVNRDPGHARDSKLVMAALLHDHRLLGGGRGPGSRGRLRPLRQCRSSHRRQRNQGNAHSVMHGVSSNGGCSTFPEMTPAMPERCTRPACPPARTGPRSPHVPQGRVAGGRRASGSAAFACAPRHRACLERHGSPSLLPRSLPPFPPGVHDSSASNCARKSPKAFTLGGVGRAGGHTSHKAPRSTMCSRSTGRKVPSLSSGSAINSITCATPRPAFAACTTASPLLKVSVSGMRGAGAPVAWRRAHASMRPVEVKRYRMQSCRDRSSTERGTPRDWR
ncbi:TetR family transcriptional regulator [Myxococcus sp. SDU36]|nr:TetR family transcriptional regulator [Myxococcus sp. SDU36]